MKNAGHMKKYVENIEDMEKYVENMKRYVGNMWKIYGNEKNVELPPPGLNSLSPFI